MNKIIKALLLVLVVVGILYWAASALLGAKRTWTSYDEAPPGMLFVATCEYYGWWSKVPPIKIVAWQSCRIF